LYVYNSMRIVVAILFLLASAGVHETLHYAHYVIHGDNTETLAEQMRSLGPKNADEIAPAVTKSDRRASMTYLSDGHVCRIKDVTVSVDVTIILPRWDIPRDASPALVAEWGRFSEALERHEQGHRAIAIAGAKKLADALNQLHGRTCDAVHTAAEYASRDEAAETRAAQIAYDDSTRHGLAQGTAFANVR
jgi:predicted secreted Zn-dependent protease